VVDLAGAAGEHVQAGVLIAIRRLAVVIAVVGVAR
jgi:hypothetical protein